MRPLDKIAAAAVPGRPFVWDTDVPADLRRQYGADILARYREAVMSIDCGKVYDPLPTNQRFVLDSMAYAFFDMIRERRPFSWLPQTSMNWRRNMAANFNPKE